VNVSRIVAAAALFIFVLDAPAYAHVTISPATLPAGEIGELTFRSPNEGTSAITQFVVQMPPDDPLAVVEVRPTAGWHATLTMRTLATPLQTPHGPVKRVVDTIAWVGGSTATGAAQTFTIRAGPLPRGVSELAFKALQTYADGSVVRWIQLRDPGDPAPPNPAPVLHLR
jgi:uncharacterized protein YcnI